MEVTDLRLLLFANGVGLLTIGVEAHNIPYAHALWINEMMRKVYASSRHQIETQRIPKRLALVQERGEERRVIAEERWDTGRGIGYRPQLSAIVLSLLHFANYAHEEFEATLDERMIVNSFVSLDRTRLPAGFETSEDYEMAFSRLLYVDRDGGGYRYEPRFLEQQMRKQVYRRWQHEGTLYGMTAYSSVTSTFGLPDAAEPRGGGSSDVPREESPDYGDCFVLPSEPAGLCRRVSPGVATAFSGIFRGNRAPPAYSVCHPVDG